MLNKKFFRKAMAILLLVFAMFVSMPFAVWADTPGVVNIGATGEVDEQIADFLAALDNPRVHTINWTPPAGTGAIAIRESFTIPPGVTVNFAGRMLALAHDEDATVTNNGTINSPNIAVGRTLINNASGRIYVETEILVVFTLSVVNNYGTISASWGVSGFGTINNNGTFLAGGTVAGSVNVQNNPIVPSPHGQLLVTIVPPATEVELLTAVQEGGTSGTVTSTGIVLTFDTALSELPAEHISIGHGTGNAFVSGISGSGTTWTVQITNVVQGTVYVNVDDFGAYEFTNVPLQTNVYAITPPAPPAIVRVTVDPPADPVEITTAGTTPPGKQFIATAYAANGTTVVPGVRFAWTLRNATDGTDISVYLLDEHHIHISETGLLIVPADATPTTTFYVRATFAGWQ